MKWSEWLSLSAVLISFLALILPAIRSRQCAKIVEVLSVPTFARSTWIYVVIANRSTTPLSIHGASLDGIRVYRHRHYFADRPDEGKQFSTSFPIHVAPQSEAGILIEFVKKDHKIDRNRELELILYSDRRHIKRRLVINQTALDIPTALREI